MRQEDTQARHYGYNDADDWLRNATTREPITEWLPQWQAIFEQRTPLTSHQAGLINAYEQTPTADWEWLEAAGCLTTDGHLTYEATMEYFDALTQRDKAST